MLKISVRCPRERGSPPFTPLDAKSFLVEHPGGLVSCNPPMREKVPFQRIREEFAIGSNEMFEEPRGT